MTATGAGGASRTERVLDPSFVEDLRSLSIEEIRRRRDEALAEREFQSYLRRLVQVRQDIVRDERDRRRQGGEPGPLIDRIKSALAEGSVRGPARGEALSLGPSAEDIEEAERLADAASGDLVFSDPASLDDETLRQTLDVLAEHERSISGSRLAVLKVHDQLQEELKRRYREDPSLIPTEV